MGSRNVRSLAAETAFRDRLAQLGAVLLEPEWLGSKAKHRAICAAGHECTPSPHYVQHGDGICNTCGGHDVAAAEAKFRARLLELGAELLEPGWLGARTKHHCLCAAGHDCYPRPNSLQQGNGVCWLCSGRNADVAEAGFRARVEALGGVVLYDEWRGANQPHHIRCNAGHDAYPHPGGVQQGGGICGICAQRSPAGAEAAYRALLEELGATPLWERWGGNKAALLVRCPEGHTCSPRPNDVMQGSGLCRACAGLDPAVSEAKFLARLAELGATPMYEAWAGSQNPHAIRCAASHLASPRPSGVIQGQGVCRICTGREWDAFYVVASSAVVKFGVTSGEPGPRIRKHASDGYTDVIRLVTGLPGTVAPDAERAIKAALALAGEKPVRGKEYFDISCLALILDVADSWLGTSAETAELEWVQEALFAA